MIDILYENLEHERNKVTVVFTEECSEFVEAFKKSFSGENNFSFINADNVQGNEIFQVVYSADLVIAISQKISGYIAICEKFEKLEKQKLLAIYDNSLVNKNVLSEYFDNKLACNEENIMEVVNLLLKALNPACIIGLDIEDIMRCLSKNICNAACYCGSRDDILGNINISKLEEAESDNMIMHINGDVSLVDSSELVSAMPQSKNIIFSCYYEQINTIEVLLLY